MLWFVAFIAMFLVNLNSLTDKIHRNFRTVCRYKMQTETIENDFPLPKPLRGRLSRERVNSLKQVSVGSIKVDRSGEHLFTTFKSKTNGKPIVALRLTCIMCISPSTTLWLCSSLEFDDAR